MVIKVGINGFGRVGRVVFRTCLDHPDIKVSLINDPAVDVEYICYLMKYDSTHGRLKSDITLNGNQIQVDDWQIKVYQEKIPQKVPWHTAGVHYVIEASGMFTNMEKASGHLIHEGVRRVIVTAPSVDVPMLILGVNELDIKPDMKIVSCGSSTLYCLAPIAKVLEDEYGIEEGFVTSIHAMTPSLKPLDGLCLKGKHWRDHRSITQNIIPAATGACKALGRIIPSLRDKMCGLAFRVPITNVSVLDVTVRLQKYASLQSIAASVEKFSKATKQTIMKITTDEVVSSDFIGDRYSCILDLGSSIQLKPDSFKLVCWYENEYSYACRVLDLIMFSEKQFAYNVHRSIVSSVPRAELGTQTKMFISNKVKPLIKPYIAKTANNTAANRFGPLPVYNPFCMHRILNEDLEITRQNNRHLSPGAAVWPTNKLFSPLKKKKSIDSNAMQSSKVNFIKSTGFTMINSDFNVMDAIDSAAISSNDSTIMNSTGSMATVMNSTNIVTTTTTGCIQAQGHLETVKKEFSKMVDLTENLLKQSVKSRVDIQDSELKSEKIAYDNKEKNKSSKAIEQNDLEKNTYMNNVAGFTTVVASTSKQAICIDMPIITNDIHSPMTNSIRKNSSEYIDEISLLRIERKRSEFTILEYRKSTTMTNNNLTNNSETRVQVVQVENVRKEKQEPKRQEASGFKNISDEVIKHFVFQPAVTVCQAEKIIPAACKYQSFEKESSFESVKKAVKQRQSLKKEISPDLRIEKYTPAEIRKSNSTSEQIIEFILNDGSKNDLNKNTEDRETIENNFREIIENLTKDSGVDGIENNLSKNTENRETIENIFREIIEKLIVDDVDDRALRVKFLNKNNTKESTSSEGYQEKLCASNIEDIYSTISLIQEKVCKVDAPRVEELTPYQSTRCSSSHDIFDKLDSASNSNSSSNNNLLTDKKKSQIITLADVTTSLEDLDRLDKICRILEISDELSDELFSPLNQSVSENKHEPTETQWSFKDLCERIHFDEFCDKVFGK